MEREFTIIKEYFAKLDMAHIREHDTSVWPTEYGLFGSSDMYDVLELFKRIGMESFVDLGSGDGRIVLLAGLFTDATGIEGDPALHAIALKAKEDLMERIPELERCTFIKGDYSEMDLSGYRTFFIYADHDWPEGFQKQLMRYEGMLYSLHNIYKPSLLKRARTYWIGQVPFISYALGASAGSGR